MDVKVVAGDIVKFKSGATVLSIFEGSKQLQGDIATIDKALDGAISKLVAESEIKGKFGEITIIHGLGKIATERVVVAGLGKKKELTPGKVRSLVAQTCRLLRQKGVLSIATAPQGAGIAGISVEGAAQAVTEGALLGLYSFRTHITTKPEHGEIKQLCIVSNLDADIPTLERGSTRGKLFAEVTNLARDMVNEPANYMTPGHMARIASEAAKSHGLEITILEREEIRKQGMGALLGVAQGSQEPPKFIVLNYRGSESPKIDIALIGKAITFDSGGISIKPSEKMEEMKGDMAGGAAVIAAMSAIAQLKPKINVMAIIAATENLPDGSALKPGDVVTAVGGKTIEIISTDAEGRLTLADAIGYARKFKVGAIIDVATLTGACRVALGDLYTGVFGNNQKLTDRVIAAGNEAGELLWQLPMHVEYKELNKSDVADIKNVGGRYGGAITAAQFLAEFVGDTPWVHMDIAGTFMNEKERAGLVRGATGVTARTLINVVLSLVK